MQQDDDDNTHISSTFPPPPAHHKNFTAQNLDRLALIQRDKGKHREVPEREGQGVDAPEWDLIPELTPPRVDWIIDSGGYESFGEYFPIPAKLAGVEAMGVARLMPESTRHLKPYLLTLLQSHLQTTLLLLHALSHPPPPPPPEFTSQEQFDAYNQSHGLTVAQPYVTRLAEIDVNMMVAVNGLREEQGAGTMEGMLRSQVERRKEETRGVRSKCEDISKMLRGLRESAALQAASIAPSISSRDGGGRDGSVVGSSVVSQEWTLLSLLDEI